jgi:hypothetical protein
MSFLTARDGVEHRPLHAALPALGKMNTWWLRLANIVTSENEFGKNLMS